MIQKTEIINKNNYLFLNPKLFEFNSDKHYFFSSQPNINLIDLLKVKLQSGMKKSIILPYA